MTICSVVDAGLQAYVCIFTCVCRECTRQASCARALPRHDIEGSERDTLLCSPSICNLCVAAADPLCDSLDLEVYVRAKFG